MKKATSGVPKDIDEYLAGVPEPAHTTLNKIRSMIRSASPAEATEAISYGMPAFKYKGPLLAFAAFSNHCSLFPMNSSLIKAFKKELEGFEKRGRVARGVCCFGAKIDSLPIRLHAAQQSPPMEALCKL